MSLWSFAGRRERGGYFGWLQPSRCLLPAGSAARKHQGMFGCFGWHLTRERITDFIVRPQKSVKNSPFTFWILDKLQFYFICTHRCWILLQSRALIFHSPRQGVHSKKLHTWVKKYPGVLFFLPWVDSRTTSLGDVSLLQLCLWPKSTLLLCWSCHLSGIPKQEGLADTHRALLWRQDEWKMSHWVPGSWKANTHHFILWIGVKATSQAEPRVTHSDSKWQKTPAGHTARQECKVLVSPEIPRCTHALRTALTQISWGKQH